MGEGWRAMTACFAIGRTPHVQRYWAFALWHEKHVEALHRNRVVEVRVCRMLDILEPC